MSSNDASLHGREKTPENRNFLLTAQQTLGKLRHILLGIREGGKGKVQDLVKVRKRFCRLSSDSLNDSSCGERHCLDQGSPRAPSLVLWAVAWQVYYMNTSIIFHLETLGPLLTFFENLGHIRGCHLHQHPYLIPGGLAKEAEVCCSASLWSLHLHLPKTSSFKTRFQACVLACVTAHAAEQGLDSSILCW